MRSLITLAILGALVFVGATVKMGKRTFFGHVGRIWQAEETQELVDGVKESSGPAVDKVKRGVKAGWDELNKSDADGGSGDGGAGDEGGVLGGLRERAADEVSDRAGDAAKDVVKGEVKDQLSGDGKGR